MTMTGRTLDEYMDEGAAGIVALSHFAANLPLDSAVIAAESEYPMEQVWMTRQKTNLILADIYDLVSGFMWTWASAKSKKKRKRPEPYPRPWTKKEKKRIGKGAIKAGRFADWWNSKKKR